MVNISLTASKSFWAFLLPCVTILFSFELQQVHMARRDPEKTLQSRNTSFLSVQTKEEGEDWVDLILHKASTQEAQGAVQRLRSYKVVKNE